MKKYLAIAAAMIFVFGFAASAFAIHAEIPAETSAIVVKGDTQLSLGGEIRMRGMIKETDFDTDTASVNGYDGRVRLNLDVSQGPASGQVQLESGSSNASDTYAWGKDSAATGVYGFGNAKRGELRILQAWAMYKTDVLGVKVGHMPLALGNKIFFNHTKFGDDAIVIFADPAKGVHVAGLTIKFEDNGDANSDDQDAYVVLGMYTADNWGISGDVTYVNMNSGSTAAGAFGGPSDLTNIGVRGNVKAGSANIWGDIEYQMGTFAKDAPGETDHSAYAIAAGADIDLGAATVYAGLGMGTGQDPTSTDSEAFVTSLGAHQNQPIDTFIYDYLVPGACGSRNTGICNTTFVKAGAKVKVGGVGLDGKIVYLMATEDVVGLNGGTTEESDLGIEIDVKASYNLAKNLKYWIETGYLSPGAAYEDAAGDADGAYAIRHGIALNF